MQHLQYHSNLYDTNTLGCFFATITIHNFLLCLTPTDFLMTNTKVGSVSHPRQRSAGREKVLRYTEPGVEKSHRQESQQGISPIEQLGRNAHGGPRCEINPWVWWEGLLHKLSFLSNLIVAHASRS